MFVTIYLLNIFYQWKKPHSKSIDINNDFWSIEDKKLIFWNNMAKFVKKPRVSKLYFLNLDALLYFNFLLASSGSLWACDSKWWQMQTSNFTIETFPWCSNFAKRRVYLSWWWWWISNRQQGLVALLSIIFYFWSQNRWKSVDWADSINVDLISWDLKVPKWCMAIAGHSEKTFSIQKE